MYKHRLLVVAILPLAACQSAPMTPSSEYQDYVQIAEENSCDEISSEIERMEKILDSATPSETEALFRNTAISAARTGLNLSGALGSAGAFANLGIGFMHNLYNINAKKRQQQMKDIALERQSIMLDAYYYKGCDG